LLIPGTAPPPYYDVDTSTGHRNKVEISDILDVITELRRLSARGAGPEGESAPAIASVTVAADSTGVPVTPLDTTYASSSVVYESRSTGLTAQDEAVVAVAAALSADDFSVTSATTEEDGSAEDYFAALGAVGTTTSSSLSEPEEELISALAWDSSGGKRK